MKKLLVLIPLLTAFACAAQENSIDKQISGTYIFGGDHFSGGTLVLNKDSSFRVTDWSDVAGEFTGKGKWTKRIDTVIFTERKERDLVATVVSKYDPGLKGSRFEVLDARDSLSMPLCQLYVDGKKLSRLHDNVFVSDSSGIRHLRVLFSTHPVYIPNLNIKHNSFLIYLDFRSWQRYSIDPLWVLRGNILVSKAHPSMKYVKSPGYARMIQFQCYTKSSCSDTLKLLDGYELTKPGFTYYALNDGPVATLPDTGIYVLSSNEVAELGDIVKVHIHYGENIDTLKQMDLYQNVIMPKDHHQKGGKVWGGWFYCNKKAQGHCVDYYQNGNKRVEGIFRDGEPLGKIRYYDMNGLLTYLATYNKQGRFIHGEQVKS